MSKIADNAKMAGILQIDLKAGGWYHGIVDEWAGPATQSAYARSKGQEPPVRPPVTDLPPSLVLLPKPAEFYVLPRETQSAMTAFYGEPSKNPTNLDWFSFPYTGIRLFSRDGVILTDKVNNDGLPDHRCHRLLVGRFEAALMEIFLTLDQEHFEKEGWHIYGGFHNYRNKTGGSGLSTHAWAVAVDLNQDENYYAKTTATFSDTGINIMEKWGFLSGFRAWGKDPMHFQAVIPNLSPGSYYSRNGFPKNIKIAA